eukprot:TRINITY_DN4962_c0_g1_i2.p2 TRINITY_DN4962_c0_g1~~TRINITY_DN4962_c0_g1_i2.p2  ORF type:complete len:110 (+),score=3.05 TRINITY_DN4962_c0_g1_i2:602-931(+)
MGLAARAHVERRRSRPAAPAVGRHQPNRSCASQRPMHVGGASLVFVFALAYARVGVRLLLVFDSADFLSDVPGARIGLRILLSQLFSVLQMPSGFARRASVGLSGFAAF